MTIRLHRGDLPDLSRYTDSVAIDTETMGLHPHRDRLCVVQMSNGDGTADVIQIPKGHTDSPNLKALLANPAITKIFHFARFDVAGLYNTSALVKGSTLPVSRVARCEDFADPCPLTNGRLERVRLPRWCSLEPQYNLMRAFDALAGRPAPIAENVVIGREDGLARLIDHAGAFAVARRLDASVAKPQVGAELTRRLRRLTAAKLAAALAPWLDRSQQKALLARRDALLANR